MATNLRKKSAEQPRTYIREWRKKRGLTQEQVAEVIGKTKAAISRYETGERDPGISGLYEFAAVFDVEPSQLLRDPEAQSLDDLIEGVSESERKQIKSVVSALVASQKNN